MRFYWDALHFKEDVGDWVLDRLFGTRREGHDIPDDFGRLLTPDTVEAVIAEMRKGRENYVQTHPEDANFIRRLIAERRGARVEPPVAD